MAHEGVVEYAEGERQRAAKEVGAYEDGYECVVDRKDKLVVPNGQDEVDEAEH